MDANGAKSFYPRYYAFNLARNALAALLAARGAVKVYVPDYLCGCIFDVLSREGIAYQTYSVDRNLRPQFNQRLAEGQYLYVVNYYGILSQEDIAHLRDAYGRVIVDNAQAFFQPAVQGVDTIYTCRKFFGVADGAYLATDAAIDYSGYPSDQSANRLGPALCRVEQGASAAFAQYQKQEQLLDAEPIRRMSAVTRHLMAAVDYDHAQAARIANYTVLRDALQPLNQLALPVPYVPFAYPFYHPNAAELRDYLVRRRVYVPTLWPNVRALAPCWAVQLTEQLLPLPCDQRYTAEDMRYIVDNIHSFLAQPHA